MGLSLLVKCTRWVKEAGGGNARLGHLWCPTGRTQFLLLSEMVVLVWDDSIYIRGSLLCALLFLIALYSTSRNILVDFILK